MAADETHHESWADIMSNPEDPEKEEEEVTAPLPQDACDHLLRFFPVPGEIWVHLRSRCNYLSSLLVTYNPPLPGEPPFLVNGWRSVHEVSPYRVTYGIRNPALRGLVLTSDTIIPNFSWTPRLALDADAWTEILASPPPADLLMLPAVTRAVVRVFQHDGRWFVADHQKVEPLGTGTLSGQFETCLFRHFKWGLLRFVANLQERRVWFFGLGGGDDGMLFLGTCVHIPQSALPVDPRQQCPDLDFSVHKFLPPCIPILPDLQEIRLHAGGGCFHDADTLSYTCAYDGLLLVNPTTLFAVRLCEPEVVYLTPLLNRQQNLPEFLAAQMVHIHLTDASRVHVDRASHRWWKELLEEFTNRVFGESQSMLLAQIHWQIQHIQRWIAPWMGYVSSLCLAEFQRLDVDLQRLYVLLDYVYDEDGGAWHRVLRNPKYSLWVAKTVIFVLEQCNHPL